MRAMLLVVMVGVSQPALAQHAEPAGASTGRPVVTEITSGALLTARGFTGTVEASSETDLAFSVPGRLAERRVSTGDVVARNDVLALLDPTDLEIALRGAEAGVRLAQAEQMQARDAENRAVELAARGVGTDVSRDAAATARVAADARLVQAIATRDGAADRRDDTALLAPNDGIVVSEMVENGATLAAGQAVLRLATIAEREAVIDVTEAERATLPPDATFVVTLLAQPTVTARAVLDRVAPTAAQETRLRQVHLTLIDPAEGFRLGALVVAVPEGDTTTISLPATAIVHGDDAAGEAESKAAVWTVSRRDGRVSLVAVTTGAEAAGRIAILSGLVEGQEVITRGVHSLAEGQIVGPRIGAIP